MNVSPLDFEEPLPEADNEAANDEGAEYRQGVKDAKGPLVRCLTADEFFIDESDAKLVVPALGVCSGPPLGIVGQAYCGKTLDALSFGLSIATGRDLWGAWSVQQGIWLHLDYEQGRRHTKKRIRRLARGMGVTDEQLRGLIEDRTIRVAVFPELNLTTDGASDHFAREFEGVSLVTCDSLRVMLGGVDENSSQVRSLMKELSRASEKTEAAVALIHHAGKTPLDGERARKEMARGSSAILDEFQSMLVMSKKKGDAVALVTHEKDRELGHEVADFGLRIDDVSEREDGSGDPKWGLRVVHVDRAEMQAKGSNQEKFSKAVEAVRQCIRDNPGIAGTEAVTEIIGGRSMAVRAAVNTLLDAGEVVERKPPGRGKGRRFYLSHMAPAEES